MKLIETAQNKLFDLLVDDELFFDEPKHKSTHSFILFCCDELGLDGVFTCRIVADRDKYGIKTTAFYKHNENLVVVYGKKRMLGDILRSVAHELVHRKQYQENRIDGPVQDIGGTIENEANAIAGMIVKKFINKHPLGSTIFEHHI